MTKDERLRAMVRRAYGWAQPHSPFVRGVVADVSRRNPSRRALRPMPAPPAPAPVPEATLADRCAEVLAARADRGLGSAAAGFIAAQLGADPALVEQALAGDRRFKVKGTMLERRFWVLVA